jgi:hypothetical protein
LRVTPYAVDIAGLTVVEVGTQGNYKFSGFTAYYQEAKLFKSAVELTAFGIFDVGDNDDRYINKVDAQTKAGVLTFSSSPIVPAATLTGQAMRFDETIRTSSTQTRVGLLNFEDTYPAMTFSAVYAAPTSSFQFTPKQYVDELYAGATGMVQSTYEIQCLPTRTTEDTLSKMTLEKCRTYLAALTSITTRRGLINIGLTGTASNNLAVDDGVSQWVSAGIDIFSKNKTRLTRAASNNSLTSDSKLSNIYLYDNNVVSARAYINFIFEDCDFYCNTNDLDLTTCTFLGINRIWMNGGALTLANCKGTSVWTNGVCTPTGTQPIDVRTELDIADLW